MLIRFIVAKPDSHVFGLAKSFWSYPPVSFFESADGTLQFCNFFRVIIKHEQYIFFAYNKQREKGNIPIA